MRKTWRQFADENIRAREQEFKERYPNGRITIQRREPYYNDRFVRSWHIAYIEDFWGKCPISLVCKYGKIYEPDYEPYRKPDTICSQAAGKPYNSHFATIDKAMASAKRLGYPQELIDKFIKEYNEYW